MTSPTPASARWILASVVLSAGVVFLDATVVNVAIVRIGEELPGTLVGTFEAQAYITSGYLAVLAALLVLAGAMADRYGRRRVFTVGLVAFGVTSVLCGVAPSLEFLILARLAQGAAGALLVPGALAIITTTFQGAARARAFGIWAAATSAFTVVGPLVGGVLVDTLSWRAAFLVNVPIVLVALYGALRYIPESRDDQAPRRLDWAGALVIVVAVGGISFGLIRGTETDWSEPAAIVSLAAGVGAAILLPIHMLRRADPLIPPSLFRIRDFTIINASTFLIYGAFYVTTFLQYLFLQGVLGYTALAAALAGLPSGILLMLGSAPVGRAAGRIGPWPFLVAGPAIMAVGQLWLARIPSDSPAWSAQPGSVATLVPPAGALVDVLPATVLTGLGITLVVAPLTTALMASVPLRNAGVGSAVNNAISRVGQPLVLAVLFWVISATFWAELTDREPGLDAGAESIRSAVEPMKQPDPSLEGLGSSIDEASTAAFQVAMLGTAGLLAAGAAVNSLGLRRRRSPGEATEDAAGTVTDPSAREARPES